MKKYIVLTISVCVFVFALALAQPASAVRNNPTAMNAKFTHFQEEASIIHILVFNDAGRFGIPAVVEAGTPLLFGNEWGGVDTTDLQTRFIDDPRSTITVSIDEHDPIDIKAYYQPPFVAATLTGPAWSWDHDGDGPYDGDGDGVGDWNTPLLFFRYPYSGLSSGLHTFVFRIEVSNTSGVYDVFVDTILVEVLP